jgi:putative flippase GtrA
LSEVRGEVVRYLVNGVAATIIHFGCLSILIYSGLLSSAGLANLFAAIAGITASFLGSRYFVFRGHSAGFAAQLWRFVAFYGLFAVIHAGVLFVWTDVMHLDFRIGFLLATGLQMLMSFSANKLLVFSK